VQILSSLSTLLILSLSLFLSHINLCLCLLTNCAQISSSWGASQRYDCQWAKAGPQLPHSA